jgi:CDP-diacylglycerol--glycerol-3-phosphate 3-phosphatidyltransferase
MRGRSRVWTELGRVPNLLSLSRIALIYLSAAVMLAGRPILAVVIGVVAGITDYLDGWLARRLGLTSDLGAILDRLCDLVFESTWLVVALVLGDFSPVVLCLYLFREFVVLSARLWCSAHGVPLPSTFVGKLKTNFLGYTAFVVYLSHAHALAPLQGVLRVLGDVGIFGGLALGYASACGYLRRFAAAYDQDREPR